MAEAVSARAVRPEPIPHGAGHMEASIPSRLPDAWAAWRSWRGSPLLVAKILKHVDSQLEGGKLALSVETPIGAKRFADISSLEDWATPSHFHKVTRLWALCSTAQTIILLDFRCRTCRQLNASNGWLRRLIPDTGVRLSVWNVDGTASVASLIRDSIAVDIDEGRSQLSWHGVSKGLHDGTLDSAYVSAAIRRRVALSLLGVVAATGPLYAGIYVYSYLPPGALREFFTFCRCNLPVFYALVVGAALLGAMLAPLIVPAVEIVELPRWKRWAKRFGGLSAGPYAAVQLLFKLIV